MTAVWGPLGWMTLHSVSTLYPEQPTTSEKNLMKTWLDMFRDTITCHHCKSHFTEMLDIYRSIFPGMLNNRREFMAFAFRAHNTVNRRLHKPLYGTLDECMERLRENVKLRSAAEYRAAYLNHIRRYWSTMRDTSGMVAIRKIIEMVKIENEYCKTRDTNFQVSIEPIDVLLPYGVLEKKEESVLPRRRPRDIVVQPAASPSVPDATPLRRIPVAGFRVTPNGIRLR